MIYGAGPCHIRLSEYDDLFQGRSRLFITSRALYNDVFSDILRCSSVRFEVKVYSPVEHAAKAGDDRINVGTIYADNGKDAS